MKNFFKKIFKTKSEDILFAYREALKIGIVDARGIEKYLRKNRGNNVFVFTEENINDKVKRYFKKLKNTELVKCKNVRKEIKRWENCSKFKDKKIKKISLDDFGTRPIQRDID